jgi:hypothetical protein
LQGKNVTAPTPMETSAITFLFTEIGGIAVRIGTGWSTPKLELLSSELSVFYRPARTRLLA